MSGGHWDSAGFKIQEGLLIIAEDEDVKTRWPAISEIFKGLSETIYRAEHDMDWDLSGDSHIPDDKKFDLKVARTILLLTIAACPGEWFPKGKWAIIQAVGERSWDD